MCTLKGLAVGAIGWLMAVPAGAGAQSVVRGRVLEDSTRALLSGVEILVSGSQAIHTTVDGLFTLDSLKAGMHQILFRRIGFRPVRLRALLVDGDTLDRTIVLERAAVELAPLEVTVSNVPPGMERFAERRAAGRGKFFDSKVMRQSEHRRLPDLLSRVAGVRAINYTEPGTRKQRAAMATRRGGEGMSGKTQCFMAIWYDGVKIFEPTAGASQFRPPPDIADFRIQDLEAVEVYEGPASLPPELSGTGGMCGAVVLWSRRR
jgi:hypothetical protein